ncbi:hypothetical protein C8F04DRAFT_1197569 [Mycena alexandri]|uniref:Uncharacterized protein n=1 Tax=Mycena alexandri TaxID=1745969 RepID=A0AAD6S3G7_9AGAR|nr:hypothetical protein C8F04DRAFT_1197569 [Mycena alexandri]
MIPDSILASPTSFTSGPSLETVASLNAVTDQLANLAGLNSPETTPHPDSIQLPPTVEMDIDIRTVDMNQHKDALDVLVCRGKPEGLRVRGNRCTPWYKINYSRVRPALKPNFTDDCVAAVVLTSDFIDRTGAADAIAAILIDEHVPDADKVKVLPAFPKVQATGDDPMAIMPFTQIIINCTAAFKQALDADSIFHGTHNGRPVTFYCIPVNPPTPFIFSVFTGFTSDATANDVTAAVFTSLIQRPDFLQMVAEDHSNITGDLSHYIIILHIPDARDLGELKPELVLAIAMHWATVETCTVYRGGRRHGVPLLAHRLSFPPISKDHTANQRLQRYIMSPGFMADGRRFGEGRPWFKGSATSPEYMSCSECHGIDHYKEFCTVSDSRRYRELRGIPEPTTDESAIPTSLLETPQPGASNTNDWTPVPYRGGGRGGWRPRGAPRGHAGGYNAGYNGGNGYNGGYGGGYNGGGRGASRGGGSSSRGYTYKPYQY